MDIEHVGDATGHPGSEVTAGGPQDDDAAASHVFATVVADAFHDGSDAGIADAEALASAAVDVDLAGRGTIHGDVADDDVVLSFEAGVRRRVDDEFAAGEALAEVVVGVALDGERHAARDEGAEALTGRTLKADTNGVLWETLRAVFLGDLVAGDRAGDAVDVLDRQLGDDLLAALDGGCADAEERRDVEGLVEAVVLFDGAEATDLGADVRRVKDLREIETFGFPVRDGALRFEAVGTADHLFDGAEAELGHELAHFCGDERHEIHDVLGLAGEFGAEPRVLSRHTRGAGVEMADAHHDAAGGNERSGRETKFFGAEQRGHNHVAAGLELAVRLNGDA